MGFNPASRLVEGRRSMPGTYTHLTFVRLLISGKRLNDAKLPPEARASLIENPEFCQMGAISPDYPYLNLVGDREMAEHWANSMHHKYVIFTRRNIFHLGVDYLRQLKDVELGKCFSWFLGYASHVVADVVCHPVTNLLVGDYDAGNEVAHRESEMHQDVYIFRTRLGGDVSKSEQIKNVIGCCTDPDDGNRIHGSIERMWRHLLSTSFPDILSDCKLDIHGWHRSVQVFLDDIAEELSVIPSRHIRKFMSKEGIAYPRFEEIDKERFITRLKTPDGEKSYDEVFDFTIEKIVSMWQLISNGVFLNDSSYKERCGIWNLDNGQEAITRKVLWEGTI